MAPMKLYEKCVKIYIYISLERVHSLCYTIYDVSLKILKLTDQMGKLSLDMLQNN